MTGNVDVFGYLEHFKQSGIDIELAIAVVVVGIVDSFYGLSSSVYLEPQLKFMSYFILPFTEANDNSLVREAPMALVAIGLVLEFPLVLQWTFQVKNKNPVPRIIKRT